MSSIPPLACGEADVGDRLSGPSSDEYALTPEDAGLTAEFEHASPFHLKMAQKVVYALGNRFAVVSLARRNEDALDEFVTAFYISSSDNTCILLARSGADRDDGGRSFLIAQYREVLEEVPNLVNQGFEVTDVKGDMMTEDLPEKYIPE